MNYNSPKWFRLLAVALTSRGLGYAVLEGEKSLVESSHSCMRGGDKNGQCVARVKKLVGIYRPGLMVLQNAAAKESRRIQRIRRLQGELVKVAAQKNLGVDLVSEKDLRRLLLGNPRGTKDEIAEMLAQRFPNELALRLPAKRRPWQSEDSRMDLFDAVALAVAFRFKGNKATAI